MKNKKILTIIAVVVMSGVLLTAGVMASNPAGSAYEQFKSLLSKDHESIENATVNMNVSVVDNGQTVIAIDGSMKVDKQSNRMSGTFQTSGKTTKSFELYKNNDDVLLRLAGSENWYKGTHREEKTESRENFGRRSDRNRSDRTSENKQLEEAFLDALMGNYKDQVNMIESNGQRTFSLSFDEGNMPLLLQTAFQLSDDRNEKGYETPADLSRLPQELQDVLADIKNCEYDAELVEKKLESIKISITVDDNDELTAMGLSMNCSGTDAQGAEHDLEFDFSMDLSDVGVSVIDEANPDPEKVTAIDCDIFIDAGSRHCARG